MYFYTKDIKKLQKFLNKIDYLDIGSRGGIEGWFKILENKLNITDFEANDGTAIFNKKLHNKDFFLTKNPKQSSLFEPNKDILKYEGQSDRLKFEKIKINTDTLDNLFSNKNIDIVKVDTQGSEYEILEGGLNFIKNQKPLLFLETWIWEYYKNIKFFDQIIGLLRSVNYELFLIDTAAGLEVDLKGKFKSNIGDQRAGGFNLFMAPNLDEIKKLKPQKRIKMSFIFFSLNLLSQAYFIIEDLENSEFKNSMEEIINQRIKYKNFYKLKKLYAYLKLIILKKNENFFKLT